MQTLKVFNLRKLWLSLLLLVGATAIAVPGIQEIAEGSNVAKIGSTEYATLQAAVDAAQNGETVTLFANTTENIVVEAGKNITLSIDKNVTLSGGGFTNRKAAIKNEGTLTIKGSGTIKREDTAADNGDGQAAYYVILNNGTMSISGVTVTNNSGPSTANGKWSGSALICNGTTNTSPSLTISGGTYTQENFIVIKNDDYGTLNITGGKFNTNNQAVQNWNSTTISGGTFNGDVYSWAWEGNGAQSNPTVTISGGTFNNCEIGTEFDGNVSSNSPTVNITNGTFNDVTLTEAEGSELSISGGKFTVQPDETLLANGMTLVKTSATQWTVVAESEATAYNVEITDANGNIYLNKFGGGIFTVDGTYKLLSDVTTNSRIGIVKKVNFTLDLNGHTVTSNYNSSNYGPFYVTKSSMQNASGSTISIVDNSDAKGGRFVAEGAENIYAIGVSEYVSNVTLNIGKGVAIEGNAVLIEGTDNTLNVEGTIKGGDDFAVVTNGSTTKNATINIKEGAVLSSNSTAVYLPGTGTTTIEEGAKITGSTGIYVKSGTLNINGGEITGNGEKKDYEYWNNGCHSTGDALVVDNCGYPGGDPAVSVTGGTFTSTNADAIGSYRDGEKEPIAHFVSGGYFSNQISDDLCIEGKTAIEATDKPGYFTIGDPHYVAQIGTTGYVTLQAAVDAAYATTGNVTIELLDNITEYAIVKQKADLNLTIDGKEKTMSGNIVVNGMGRSAGTETLTIQNIKFEGDKADLCSGTSSFVEVPSLKTSGTPYYTNGNNYAHNITISNCSFTSTEIVETERSIRAFGSASGGGSCYNITINKVTGSNLHSLAQFVGTTGANVTNCTIENGESFVNVSGGAGEFAISGNTFTSADGADGYGIRENGTSSAVITLTDNTFNAANAVVMGKKTDVTAGTINVVSGTYVGDITKTAAATGKIVISGGKFSAPLGNSAYAQFIEEGKTGVNGLYPEEEQAKNGLGEAVATITDSEGKVTNYAKLESAFADAKDGDTVKPLVDITELASNITVGGTHGDSPRVTTAVNPVYVTFDLNGKTIKSDKTIYLVGGSLNITGEGTIETTGSGVSPVGVRYQKDANHSDLDYTSKRTLTIGENVTLKGVDYGLNIFGSNEGTVVNDIEVNVNGTVEGTLFVLGNLKNTDNNVVVNVNSGASLKGNVGIALNGFATVNVADNTTIEGTELGIEVRAGNLNVAGGKITSTATEYTVKSNGDGSAAMGAAISVAQHTTGLPISTNITGCKLTGVKTISVADPENGNLAGVKVKVADALANAETVIIPTAYEWVSDGAGMSTLTPRDPVAKIGETVYYSLADAIAAVPTNGTETTINLLANVSENVSVGDGKNIILDLGENTLTGMIDQYDSQLTVKNGDVAGTVYVNGGPASAESGYNKFTLAENATITSDWGFMLYQSPNGNDAYGSVIDINGTVNGTAWVMGNIKEGNSVINVNNGAKIQGSVFGLNGLATLNVKEGATIIGSETGIEVRAGNLNVEGGTITSTATAYTVTPNGSGTTTDGAAIAVAQHTTGLPINANITGGTLSGPKTISVADPQGLNYAGVVVTAKDELTEKENNVIPDGYIWMSNNNGTSTLTKIEDGEYKLIDGKDYPFMNLKSDISVPEVTYQRSFKDTQVDKHQGWYVPMDYTITAEDAKNFTFYKLHMVAGAATPGEANPNEIYLYVTPMNVGDILKGNRPYTVKPKKAVTDYPFTATSTTLYAPNNKSRLNVTTSTHSYDFFGRYVGKHYVGNVEDVSGMFFLSGGSLHPSPTEFDFIPYRWDIKVSSNETNDGYSKIGFIIVEDGDATGINSVREYNSDEVEGIYTINGKKLDSPVKGINIIKYKNGKTEKRLIK